jgi:hypothetical protein
MASAIITRDGACGHLCVVLLAGAASMLGGVASCWAQEPWGGNYLLFCPVYPPGHAPAIGPSNCAPVPEALWGPTAPVPDLAARSAPVMALASLPAPEASSLKPAAPPSAAPASAPAAKLPAPPAATVTAAAPPMVAKTPMAPTLQATVALRTPGAITLDQIAAMLGPVTGRNVTFNLATADEYKKSDLTHRVSLTWSGPLQTLVDQLGAIYGLDVAIDDTAIRFSSRQGATAASSPTTSTSEGRS